MAAETNLIKKADLARVREIEFVEMFNINVAKLLDVLGVTRKQAMQAGSVLKTYKASGTLATSNAAEGDTIALSKYSVSAKNWGEITLQKRRKATSAEAILSRGYDQAVTMTTNAMLKDVTKSVRDSFFTFLGTGTGAATGVGLQAALAQSWGKLQTAFDNSDIEAVYFVNPEDVADYLAKAQITTQTAFGMSYVENFLGMGTVFMTPSVTKGTLYATAKDNLILYYVPVNGDNGLGEAFAFTTDETGYIGIHEEPDYTNMTSSDTVCWGITLLAERTDGIIKGTISAAAA